LASGRQYGNALLGVRHQEEDTALRMIGLWHHAVVYLSVCPSVCDAVHCG